MNVNTLSPRLVPLLPVIALVGVAVTWGITFSVVDGVGELMPASDLVTWRFGLATVVLSVIRRSRRRILPAQLRRRGIILGALLGLGFLLQTWAMTDTDATMSGFLIGTLVVLAPIIGWIVFRVRPVRATWIGVPVATLGLGMLSLQSAAFGLGEMVTLTAAAVWALHLVLLSRWGIADFAFELARVQTATVTAMALLAVLMGGAVTGGPLLPAIPTDGATWLSIVFLALPATAAAMIALSWAQSRVSAARTAIILTLEPAASAGTAVILGAELGLRTLLGGGLLVAAMLIVELGPRWRVHRLFGDKSTNPAIGSGPYEGQHARAGRVKNRFSTIGAGHTQRSRRPGFQSTGRDRAPTGEAKAVPSGSGIGECGVHLGDTAFGSSPQTVEARPLARQRQTLRIVLVVVEPA